MQEGEMALKILYVVLFIAAIAANIPHAHAPHIKHISEKGAVERGSFAIGGVDQVDLKE